MKKCVICGKTAKYGIKDTSDYYCYECATENYSDLSLLKVIEGRAEILKKMILDRVEVIDRREKE